MVVLTEDIEGRFVVMIDGELKEFNRYFDIPQEFDNVILFEPKWTDLEDDFERSVRGNYWHVCLQRLMDREKK